MKWGVRRGHRAKAAGNEKATKYYSKAYRKSSKKADSFVKISDIDNESLEKGKKYTYMLMKD